MVSYVDDHARDTPAAEDSERGRVGHKERRDLEFGEEQLCELFAVGLGDVG